MSSSETAGGKTFAVARVWLSRPLSLAARLTAWYSLSSFALVAAATVILYWSHAASMRFQDEQFLLNKIHVVSALLKAEAQDEASIIQEIGENVDGPRQLFARVLTREGRTLYESPGMAEELKAELFPPPAPPSSEAGGSINILSIADNPFRVLAAYAIRNGFDEPQQVIVQAAIETGTEEMLLQRYRERLALVLLVALVLCSTVGHQIAKAGLAPLRRIVAASRQVRSSTLHERIETREFPAELLELATTFNDMLDRLQTSFARVLQFSDDIAHELRTPLNNVLGEIEVALSQARTQEEYRDALASALEECGRLTRTVNSLLFLARSEGPSIQCERERLELRREVALVEDFFDAPAHEGGVALHNEVATGTIVSADRMLFQRALSNLVENALAHTPSGGSIRVSARRRGGLVAIAVADTGRGIPAIHLAHVFDRFYRVEPSRSSTNVGLGLAIVKRIALLHGGAIEIESEPRHGTCVTLLLPGAPAVETRADHGNVVEA